MKKHVWRPLFVVIGIVVFILLFRMVYVPSDFGAHERGYTFGFHRLSNEQAWKDFPDKVKPWADSAHGTIPCENCHGAAFDHPEKPAKLTVDRSRGQCLRCHTKLYMPGSGRNDIPGIDPEQHNAGTECAECHNPHNPSLEEM